MGEILEYLKTSAEVFGIFINGIIDLVTNFGTRLGEAFGLIVYVLTYIPNLIVNSIFYNLPGVFQSGLISLFSVFLLFFILKLFQLIKFW